VTRCRSIVRRLALLAIGPAMLAGCTSAATRAKRRSEARGRVVYEMYCQGCHEGTHPNLAQQPPRLAGIFQRGTLPSGRPATDATVRETIVHGRGIMPPFGASISSPDLENLIAYLHVMKVGR
jgi:mono/diheme cytochrome c family protein